MDPSVKTTIEQRLIETGEKERLTEHLRNRLIESGWRDELKLYAKVERGCLVWLELYHWFGVAYGLLLTKLRCVSQEVVQKRGLNNITHEDLVREITPKGRSLVPDVVKKELLVKIQTFLSHQQNM